MSKRGRHSHSLKPKDERTLFVSVKGSWLPDYITGQHLKQHFEQFEDDIVSAMVWREKETMKSKGYAFIKFTSSAAASEAMRILQGSRLRGKFPLTLKYATKDPGASPVHVSDSDSDSDSSFGDTDSSCDSDSSSTTLYVGVFNSKFPNYVNTGHLREHFSEFEHYIENAMIVRDTKTKQTKGYGFVTFTSHDAAALAMKKLRGSKLQGKFTLFINFKDRKEPMSTSPSRSQSRASSTVDLSSCYSDDDTDQPGSSSTLYVSVHNSKFPNHINSRHLASHFSDFKEQIKRAMIIRDRETKQSKGYGFVTFTSQSVAEAAMKRLRGSKLHGKFSLYISLKDEVKHSSTSSPIKAEKSMVLSGTTEQLLYLRHRFYSFPTVASTALKDSLPAQLMLRNESLYLFGTESAIKRSSTQIYASRLLQDLKSDKFKGTWDNPFLKQLQNFILSSINQSGEDILCILSEQQEQGSNQIAFTVQVFSHSRRTLQEALQKLNVCCLSRMVSILC